MNSATFKNALKEAARFLEKAKEYEAEISKQSGKGFYVNAPKQAGALRRASMDLTRALAEMRKPG